jgi:hypothetical protein
MPNAVDDVTCAHDPTLTCLQRLCFWVHVSGFDLVVFVHTYSASYIYRQHVRRSLRALQLAPAVQATNSSRPHTPARPLDRTTTSSTRIPFDRSQCRPPRPRVRGLPSRSATSRLPVISTSSPRSSTFSTSLPGTFTGPIMGWRLPAYEHSFSATYATAPTLCWSQYVELGSGLPLERGTICSKSTELLSFTICLPTESSLWYGRRIPE